MATARLDVSLFPEEIPDEKFCLQLHVQLCEHGSEGQ